MNRHRQLVDIIREKKPKHVIETGTCTGNRALTFMAVTNCYYTGFDLFEDATPESDKKELNVKRRASIANTGKAIEMAGLHKFCLIRGNTNKTLQEYFEGDPQPFDFAFIDGGCSIATIENDFRWLVGNIEKGGTIIIDSWYEPVIEGFGCNFIDGQVLPSTDKRLKDHTIHLLRVDV
jgi:predicted O-methyltransferase YrrM